MNCDITDRDEYLFRRLSSGPAVFPRILGWLNDKVGAKDPSAVVRNRASAVSANAVRMRLFKLAHAGYVQSKRYRNVDKKVCYTLYALTELAAQHLIRVDKIHPGNVRAYLPSSRMVPHELEVTEVVRMLKNDAMILAASLTLKDEQRLKGDRMSEVRSVFGMINPGDVFPDLYAHFLYKESGIVVTKHFAVEVDNSTIPAEKVAAKVEKVISFWKWPPVVICMIQSRVTDISRAVLSRGGVGLGHSVLLGLHSDYCRNGIFKTKWQLASGGPVSLVSVK